MGRAAQQPEYPCSRESCRSQAAGMLQLAYSSQAKLAAATRGAQQSGGLPGWLVDFLDWLCCFKLSRVHSFTKGSEFENRSILGTAGRHQTQNAPTLLQVHER